MRPFCDYQLILQTMTIVVMCAATVPMVTFAEDPGMRRCIGVALDAQIRRYVIMVVERVWAYPGEVVGAR